MDSTYYQNQINKLEKDIADLQKKIAGESKKENDKARQIDSVNRSISKYTSMSTLQSKQRQIDDILNCKRKISDYQNQIARKSIDLGKRKQDLRKAEETEHKKFQKEQLDFQKKLQNEIEQQKTQLDFLINRTYSSKEIETKESKEYDFFISHATEDKDEIVRDLANALKENGFEIL